MGELKAGWKRVKFGEIAECVNDRVDDPAKAGVERYVGLEHLDPESLTIRRWGTPDEVESTKLRFKPGDIIFGKRRAYQRKLAVADFEGICSAHAMVLRAKPSRVLPDFLPFFMQSDLFMERAVAISVGSLSPTINWKTLAAEEFALPPLEEQRCAVRMLNTQRSLIEALAQSEVSSETLARALARDASQMLPSRTLGSVTRFVTSGSRGWAEHYSNSGAWFIRVTNLLPSTIRLDLSDLRFVSPPSGAEGTRTRIRPRDVLIAITGEYLGMIALAPTDIPEAYVNQHVAVVRIDESLADPRFVAYALTGPAAQRQVWSRNDGGTKPGMNLGQVRSLPIPDVPLAQQREAADRLDQMEEVRVSLNLRLATARKMYQASLTRLSVGDL